MKLEDRALMLQMLLAIGISPQRGAMTDEARRQIYLSSQHSSLAIRSALWRFDRAKAAQALTEVAEAQDFAAAFAGITDVFELFNKQREEDKK